MLLVGASAWAITMAARTQIATAIDAATLAMTEICRQAWRTAVAGFAVATIAPVSGCRTVSARTTGAPSPKARS